MCVLTHGPVFFFRAQKSGIVDIIPGMQIDDFLFEPCGYSMNGLLPDVSRTQFNPVHSGPDGVCVCVLGCVCHSVCVCVNEC